VFEIIKSGGWMMLPIILCSIGAMGIIVERFWAFQEMKILPPELVPQVWRLCRKKKLDDAALRRLRTSSPLCYILAAGLANRHHGRDVMKECIEELGRKVVHDFIINADDKTPHQAMITALEAAGDAGFSHITFAAQHSKTRQ
jgi:biopolymer transport protein ExbB